MTISFSNKEIVVFAVYLLGGESTYTDQEDIAVKVNEIAPGRFLWKKYKNQIDLAAVTKRLYDAKTDGKLLGSSMDGWILSEKGLEFSKKEIKYLKNVDLSRTSLNQKEKVWQNREKIRMMSTKAYERLIIDRSENIATKDAEIFFRLDEYITGMARERKLARIINTFSDDRDLGWIVKLLAEKVRKNE